MTRYNPYETVLNVQNVRRLTLKWSYTATVHLHRMNLGRRIQLSPRDSTHSPQGVLRVNWGKCSSERREIDPNILRVGSDPCQEQTWRAT